MHQTEVNGQQGFRFAIGTVYSLASRARAVGPLCCRPQWREQNVNSCKTKECVEKAKGLPGAGNRLFTDSESKRKKVKAGLYRRKENLRPSEGNGAAASLGSLLTSN